MLIVSCQCNELEYLQYCVFSARHIFDSAMLSLAFLDVLTGLIATPIVTLVYYYDCELDVVTTFICSRTVHTSFYNLPKMREEGVEIR